jgi:hypothetical protein
VAISPQWTMLEEIEFHRLAKLKLEVDEPEELYATKIIFVKIFAHLLLQRNIWAFICV